MMRNNGGWFACFAEVPGVGYQGDPRRRATLPGARVVPESHTYDFDGVKRTSLSWPSRAGSSSASPVHQLAFGDFSDETSAAARERVLTALELPGELMDYHFALQGVAELLYKRRRAEPQHLALVEWLFGLDARLLEAHSEAFRISPDSDQYIGVLAIDFLISHYEAEGHLHEALAVAERLNKFWGGIDRIAPLRERVTRLREENA